MELRNQMILDRITSATFWSALTRERMRSPMPDIELIRSGARNAARQAGRAIDMLSAPRRA